MKPAGMVTRAVGLSALFAAGCGGSDVPADYGDPTSLNTPTERLGITAYVISPTVRDTLVTPSPTLVVSAWTADMPRPLGVTVAPADGATLGTTVRGNPGPDQRFSAVVPLLHGNNPLSVRIATADQSRIRYLSYAVRYNGLAPAVRGGFALGTDAMHPCTGVAASAGSLALTAARRVCFTGRATVTAGATVTRVDVRGAGGSVPAVVAPDGSFSTPVDLSPDRQDDFTVTVTDSAARTGAATASIVHDGTPPTVTVTGAAPGAVVPVTTDTFALAGTAMDANGIAALRVEFSDGGALAIQPPTGTATAWTATVRVNDGDNALTVVAVDGAGNSTRVPFVLRRDREVVLRPPSPGAGSTHLDLDRYALGSLLAPTDQQAIQLVQVSLRPTLLATLHAIRDPITSGVDTSTWGQAAWNLNRLLNMTPDTADLTGTTLAPLFQLAGAIGLPPPRVLADLVQITPTTPFVSLDTVADVLLDQLIGTHPNITRDASGQPVLALTLYDVLQDLHPLAMRFGPVGAHPGFLSGMVSGQVFEPGFLMSIPARSNLQEYEGIDAAAAAKRYLFVHGAGAGVVALDFTSPDFGVVGLVDQPVVDLGFSITENPAFLHAGTTQLAGADATRPGFYRGDGAVWASPPWQIEPIIAETAYRQFYNRFADTAFAHTVHYDAGSIHDASVIQWSRGWVTVTTSGGVGMPPPPAYVWDVLSEIAQVRLHDGGIPEGSANLAFTLHNLSIGLDADHLIASIRPTLMAQQADLSRRIVGSSALATSTADVFLLPADSATAAPFLAFRAAGDGPLPYPYATPGFFSDAGLSHRVSATSASGTADTAHEKVAVTPGLAVYVRAAGGGVYLLTVTAVTADGVRVRISRAGGA